MTDMQSETVTIDQLRKSFSVLEGMSLMSLLPLDEKRAEKNLLKTLRDHVTYPPELIGELNAYGAAFSQGLKDYDERILYNWDDYDDDEKRELLCLVHEDSGRVLGNGLKVHALQFADLEDDPAKPGQERVGEWLSSEMTGGDPLLKISNKLLKRSLPEILGVVVHEGGHGIVTQYAEQKNDVLQGKSGLMWSAYGDHARFYMNPEEALVRAFEVNVVECFAPDSSKAKTIRQNTLDEPGYGHMAAAKQFFALCK